MRSTMVAYSRITAPHGFHVGGSPEGEVGARLPLRLGSLRARRMAEIGESSRWSGARERERLAQVVLEDDALVAVRLPDPSAG
jgi:hypothetical protein